MRLGLPVLGLDARRTAGGGAAPPPPGDATPTIGPPTPTSLSGTHRTAALDPFAPSGPDRAVLVLAAGRKAAGTLAPACTHGAGAVGATTIAVVQTDTAQRPIVFAGWFPAPGGDLNDLVLDWGGDVYDTQAFVLDTDGDAANAAFATFLIDDSAGDGTVSGTIAGPGLGLACAAVRYGTTATVSTPWDEVATGKSDTGTDTGTLTGFLGKAPLGASGQACTVTFADTQYRTLLLLNLPPP